MKIVLFLLILFLDNLYAQDKKLTCYDKIERYYEITNFLARGSLDSRGLTFKTFLKPNVPSFKKVYQTINLKILGSNCRNINCAGYENDFAKITGSTVTSADELQILPNSQSFDLRESLIENAKESIHILMWGIEDDETGSRFVEQLIQAKENKPDLDIKIITDGNIANFIGIKNLRKLSEALRSGIKLMKWKSRLYHGNGNHRKMFIVDKEHLIIGGMNIANYYSHYNTSNKWRDLDVYIKGKSSGLGATSRFAQVWNGQLIEFPQLRIRSQFQVLGESDKVNHEITNIPVILVDQDPGSRAGQSSQDIHTAIVKLFRDAQKSIDIENAYFILDPIMRKELKAVIQRGVKVRIFTNSDKSIDEPIVSMHVMQSAKDAATMGAEVYLKKKLNLHSKFLVVDKKISMVGSFNFHPRSLYFDAENVAVIFDEKLSLELTAFMEEGISQAEHVSDPEELKIPVNFFGLMLKEFYFKFL